jgi:hypothetical protein
MRREWKAAMLHRLFQTGQPRQLANSLIQDQGAVVDKQGPPAQLFHIAEIVAGQE